MEGSLHLELLGCCLSVVEDGCCFAFYGVEDLVAEISVGAIHALISDILAVVVIFTAVVAAVLSCCTRRRT